MWRNGRDGDLYVSHVSQREARQHRNDYRHAGQELRIRFRRLWLPERQ